ncbi:hypothetical protein PFLA_a0457 [Pseudoalteromonas flavipulchra NCIMB 2033 = ATCC BAA-314]|nr:hypothetical protein [Pseudoalteromonas flavipulchra NCIMB 2033 = ATCC BAA-314]
MLALLIVEAFLATVLIGANLESADKVTGMWLGVGLFVLVTLLVFLLAWFKSTDLTFDKKAHLEYKQNLEVQEHLSEIGNKTKKSVSSIVGEVIENES